MARPARFGRNNPSEPVLHDLPSIRYGADLIALRVSVRRAEDGIWRGRLIFGAAEEEGIAPSTAEILVAPSESEFWEAVRDLRHSHLCDLYRSVSE